MLLELRRRVVKNLLHARPMWQSWYLLCFWVNKKQNFTSSLLPCLKKTLQQQKKALLSFLNSKQMRKGWIRAGPWTCRTHGARGEERRNAGPAWPRRRGGGRGAWPQADLKPSKVGQIFLNWLQWGWELELALAPAHADQLDCERAFLWYFIFCFPFLELCAGACFRELTTVLVCTAVTPELFAFYCLLPSCAALCVD